MFSARSFKLLAQFTEHFEKERGSGRVDVVLRSTGIEEDVVETSVVTETGGAVIVLIQFGDGHARYVPIEEITQMIVREDDAKTTPTMGFTVSDEAPKPA